MMRSLLSVSVLVTSLLWLIRVSDAISEEPVGEATSYGQRFLIPFPQVNLNTTTNFQYVIFITNPSDTQLSFTLQTHDGTTLGNLLVALIEPMGKKTYTIDSHYMMSGTGKFSQRLEITSPTLSVGVHVISTRRMDAYTALPVQSWGTHYMVVTYCTAISGPCQIVVIADVACMVTINLPAQDANTISLMDTVNPASSEQLKISLNDLEVYQLQRNYDLTGATIKSTEPVAVLSGSAMSWVGEGYHAGAFMEQLPPIKTMGTEFVVFLSPNRAVTGDLIRLVGLRDETHIYISTAVQRIRIDESQYITLKYHEPVVYIHSDKPIIVVKFSQSQQTAAEPGYPTMTFIPSNSQFMGGGRIVAVEMISEIASGSQHLVVIGAVTHLNTLDVNNTANLEDEESINGTNLAVRLYEMTGLDAELVYDNGTGVVLGVYMLFESDEMSFQIPVVFKQAMVNQPCIQSTPGDHGDNIDNDCDGEIDEDQCDETNTQSLSDCEGFITGERDVWGKQFTFLLPGHCENDQNTALLYVHKYEAVDTIVRIQTPADTSKLDMSYTIGVSKDSLIIYVFEADSLTASGSRNFTDRTIHVTSSTAEISVTLLISCDDSMENTRLIPDSVQGREYIAITVCKSSQCQIQIAAIHKDETAIRIRLQYGGTTHVDFNGDQYSTGDIICLTLQQYEAIQIQADGDLTGTHILSNKPISVLSGGKYTYVSYGHTKDSVLEQLPPVTTWGKYFIVKQTQEKNLVSTCSSFACEDFIKIVAGSSDTVIQIKSETGSTVDYHLTYLGDFKMIQLDSSADQYVVLANKAVLIMQVTVSALAVLEASGSLVTPVAQYTDFDIVQFPISTGFKNYLVISSEHTGDVSIMVEGIEYTLNSSDVLNVSIYDTVYTGNIGHIGSRGNSSLFGGYVYGIGNPMAAFSPLAFKMLDINAPCVVTTGTRGDGIDNDCDGEADEENCEIWALPTDDDGDGMYNEDCKRPSVTEFNTGTPPYLDEFSGSSPIDYDQSDFSDHTTPTQQLLTIPNNVTSHTTPVPVGQLYNSTYNTTYTTTHPYNLPITQVQTGDEVTRSSLFSSILFFLTGPSTPTQIPPHLSTYEAPTNDLSRTWIETTTPLPYLTTNGATNTDLTRTWTETTTPLPYLTSYGTTITDLARTWTETTTPLPYLTTYGATNTGLAHTWTETMTESSMSWSCLDETITAVTTSIHDMPTSVETVSDFITKTSLLAESSPLDISSSVESLADIISTASIPPDSSSIYMTSSMESSFHLTTSIFADISSTEIVSSMDMFSDLVSTTMTSSSASLPNSMSSSSAPVTLSSIYSTSTVPGAMSTTSTMVTSTLSSSNLDTTIHTESGSLMSSSSATLDTLLPSSSQFTTATLESTLSTSTATPFLTSATATIAATQCGCLCQSQVTSLNPQQVDEITSSIEKELYVDKNEVSATKRKYISVNDQRPSAQTVGYFGVSIVAVTFIGIFLLDAGTLLKDIYMLIQACKGDA